MICVPITDQTHAKALRSIERSAPMVDALELRMDLIEDGDLPNLLARARQVAEGIKVIVTCRRPEEALVPVDQSKSKPKTVRSKAVKMKRLKEAITLEADYVDIEMAEGAKAVYALQVHRRRMKSKTQIIVSWHDVTGTPPLARLKEIFRMCEALKPDVVKIVTMAQTEEDNIRILSLIPYARFRSMKIIAMCMGEKGKLSRVAAPLLGSLLGFAVLQEERASAPGQLTVRAMRQIARLLEDTPRFPRRPGSSDEMRHFILLGNPVRHSLSPLMHNTALAAMGINGCYTAFCANDICEALDGIRGLGIRGASVTIPFKTEVMEYLDEIHPDARALGAVNTIVNHHGCLIGYNTDWTGLIQSLKDKIRIKGKTIAILGAGGAARAAAYGVIREGGNPLIFNRSDEKGRQLASRFGCPFYPLAELNRISADVLVNATSVGLFPQVDQSPVPGEILPRFAYVMDIVYHPLRTKLLRDAEAGGCKTINGLEMFVRQGAEQLKLWTGKDAPVALMMSTVRERLEKN
jgi:shikimate dehydrogenase/3-dehydroquinate dehydratase type I